MAAPLLLLVPLDRSFNDDWTHHLWFSGYFGEYFRHHGVMPEALHTATAVGFPQPVFYGFLTFQWLGWIASLTGAQVALRIACVLVAAIQFHAIWAAGRHTLPHRGVRYLVAVSTVWSTYALTNLYNRSAVPEFLAVGCMVSAVSLGVAAAFTADIRERHFHVFSGTVCAVLALGGHPPTAVIGFPFLVAAAMLALTQWWRDRATFGRSCLTAAGSACLGTLVLSPWLYANLKFHSSLLVMSGFNYLAYFSATTDSVLGRFSPLPFRTETLIRGAAGDETPYLEAPINLICLLLVAFNVMGWLRHRRRAGPTGPASHRFVAWLLAAMVMLLGFLTFLSLSQQVSLLMPFSAARYVQYAYRLVSACNLSLLIAVFLSSWLLTQSGAPAYRPVYRTIALAGITLWIVSTGVKLRHAAVVAHTAPAPQFSWKGDRTALIDPGLAELPQDYATVKSIPVAYQVEPDISVWFSARPVPGRFAVIESRNVSVPQRGYYRTNILAFPWNHLTVDGVAVPAAALKRSLAFLALPLEAGVHRVAYSWRPDPLWQLLRRISAFLFPTVLASTLLWGATRAIRAVCPVPNRP